MYEASYMKVSLSRKIRIGYAPKTYLLGQFGSLGFVNLFYVLKLFSVMFCFDDKKGKNGVVNK